MDKEALLSLVVVLVLAAGLLPVNATGLGPGDGEKPAGVPGAAPGEGPAPGNPHPAQRPLPAVTPVPQRQPPPSGEWLVTGTEAFSAVTLSLNGNLTIEPGGSLTLTAVKLRLSSSFDGEFHIEVRSGASLTIEDRDHNPSTPDDATQLSAATGFQYQFWVRSGATLRIINSLVKNCGFAPGARGETAGVYLQSGDCLISNSTFLDNFCALAVDNCAPRIENNTFAENRRHGMTVRDSSLVLEDNLFDGNAANGILFQASRPTLRRNLFRGNFQNGLSAQSSPLTLEYNTFQLNRWRAVEADKSPVSSRDDEFLQNQVGFFINDTSLEASSTLMQDNTYGFYCQDARATVRNITLVNSTSYDFYLGRYIDHSEMVSYNSSAYNSTYFKFPSLKVAFGDPSSVLYVIWTVSLQVLWESTGLPAAGAQVKIYDKQMQLLHDLGADAQGKVPPLELTEFRQTKSGREVTSTYRLGLFSGRFVNSTFFTIQSDLELFPLLDDVPPRFTLSSPRDNITVNRTWVNVTGNLSTDFDAGLRVNGTQIEIDQYTGNFSVRCSLAEGPNLFNITAVDPHGNVFGVLRTVNRDMTAPRLSVDLPPEGVTLNRTPLILAGRTEPRAFVMVNGVPAMVQENGSFEFVLDLVEGANPVNVFSDDQYNNGIWVNRTVFLDTIPPEISIFSPLTGSWTNRPLMQVTGHTEDGATVTFAGEPVDANRGNFSRMVNLSEGDNLLVLWAQDRAGNRNSTTVLVRLDTVAPEATIRFPPDGTSVRITPVNISGSTEPGVVVSCRNGNVSTDGRGNFSILYDLLPGENSITLEFRDGAGNSLRLTLKVVYDTVVSFILLSPANGTRTTGSSTLVEGQSEPGAGVTIDGRNLTVSPDGRFSGKIPLRTGRNILVINVTDAAGNSATFYMLVYRDAVPGTSAAIFAVVALVILLPVAGAIAWLALRRRAPAASAPGAAATPPVMDSTRLILKPVDGPSELLRCASCLQPVEESWAVCHSCGGPTSLAQIAPRTSARLAETEFASEREKRLKTALLKGCSDARELKQAGTNMDAQERQLTIAAQLLLLGDKPELVEKMVAELDRDIGGRVARENARKAEELQGAQAQARGQMMAILSEAERSLPALRESGSDLRELERSIGLARLHLRADSLEKAYHHTMETKRTLDTLLGEAGRR